MLFFLNWIEQLNFLSYFFFWNWIKKLKSDLFIYVIKIELEIEILLISLFKIKLWN